MRKFLIFFAGYCTLALAASALPSLARATSPSPSDAIPDTLTLQAGKHQVTYSLAQLRKKLPTVTIRVDDPVYATPRRWDCFRLDQVLKLIGKTPSDADEIVFEAADGYSPSVSRSALVGHTAYLAYREHGRHGRGNRFEKVRQGKALISPAPFYLLWGEGKKIAEKYPWPYQLVKIEFVSFTQKFGKIYPLAAGMNSPAMRGFKIFKNNCLRCHSIDLIGGDIGPELNTPKSVLEYWNHKTLRKLIKNASSFRARSKMPPFPELTNQDLNDLFAYLKWAKDHR